MDITHTNVQALTKLEVKFITSKSNLMPLIQVETPYGKDEIYLVKFAEINGDRKIHSITWEEVVKKIKNVEIKTKNYLLDQWINNK